MSSIEYVLLAQGHQATRRFAIPRLTLALARSLGFDRCVHVPFLKSTSTDDRGHVHLPPHRPTRPFIRLTCLLPDLIDRLSASASPYPSSLFHHPLPRRHIPSLPLPTPCQKCPLLDLTTVFCSRPTHHGRPVLQTFGERRRVRHERACLGRGRCSPRPIPLSRSVS